MEDSRSVQAMTRSTSASRIYVSEIGKCLHAYLFTSGPCDWWVGGMLANKGTRLIKKSLSCSDFVMILSESRFTSFRLPGQSVLGLGRLGREADSPVTSTKVNFETNFQKSQTTNLY